MAIVSGVAVNRSNGVGQNGAGQEVSPLGDLSGASLSGLSVSPVLGEDTEPDAPTRTDDPVETPAAPTTPAPGPEKKPGGQPCPKEGPCTF